MNYLSDTTGMPQPANGGFDADRNPFWRLRQRQADAGKADHGCRFTVGDQLTEERVCLLDAQGEQRHARKIKPSS